MTDRNVPLWPFPGTDTVWHSPPHNLPPPRFAVGDRVTTRWGSATVLRIYDYEHFDGRAYHVRHDFSSSPPGFGHTWSEGDMQVLVEAAREDHQAVEVEAVVAPREVAQLALFA